MRGCWLFKVLHHIYGCTFQTCPIQGFVVRNIQIRWKSLKNIVCLHSSTDGQLLFSKCYLFWILFFTSWEPLNLTAMPSTLWNEKYSISSLYANYLTRWHNFIHKISLSSCLKSQFWNQLSAIQTWMPYFLEYFGSSNIICPIVLHDFRIKKSREWAWSLGAFKNYVVPLWAPRWNISNNPLFVYVVFDGYLVQAHSSILIS